MRVPCIMRWPGHIPAGTETDEVAASIDLVPTIAALCHASIPADRVLDGHDILPLMTDESATTPHHAYLYYKGNRVSAIRSGKWKLRTTPENKKKQNPKTMELFDLEADISESENVADSYPEKVAELQALAAQMDRELKQQSRPIGSLQK